MDNTYVSIASATPLSSLDAPTLPLAASTTSADEPPIATDVPASRSISTSFSPSPSASTFAGSMSSRLSSLATAAPLDAPSGRNSNIPGTAVVMAHRPRELLLSRRSQRGHGVRVVVGEHEELVHRDPCVHHVH